MKALYDINFWIHTAVYLVGIGFLVASPQARGRGLLIGSFALSLITGAAYYLPNTLLRSGALAQETYRSFFENSQVVLGAVSIAAAVLLFVYVVGLRAAPPSGLAPPGSTPETQSPSAVAAPMTVSSALFSFSGRLGRKDYWLKGFLILLPIGVINNVLFFSSAERDPVRVLCMVVAFLSFWPGAALFTKRWHDRNRSAWWFAGLLIPFAGIAVLAWLLVEVWFLKGTSGPNRFGADPLAASPAAGQGDQAPQPT